ncbi:P-loop ATPase, Sll1717 family [Micromonospora chersina]|uniref:P-loop ATPase, Sll1717 family n=1 Tax=Micromonospora chersina TaxID=47854 RepID=UPI00368E500B
MDDSSIDLTRLTFGRDDAESDIASGLLRQGFLPTAAYEAALHGRKSLVIGRKGAGKSAICRLLDGGSDGGVVASLITPDDATGEELRRFELQGLNPETAKSLVWRYVFAVQISRHLVGHARHRHRRRLRRAPANVRRLRRFLRRHHESGDQKLYDRVLSGMGRLRASSIGVGALGVNGSVEVQASEGARAARQLDVLEEVITQAIAELACPADHPTLLLAVDQVEQIWSNDPASDAMVVGLLLASKHVRSLFDGAVRCTLFLRSDIYDSLQFTESDKFHGEEERIDWTPELLGEVLLRRASASLGRPVPAEELWGRVLPEAIDGEPILDYLTSRTLLRPRDVIQFVTLCRDTAVRHGHRTIWTMDVRAAARDFSRWKLQDLGNEYLVSYPFLTRLYALFQNTGYLVTRKVLRARFAEVRDSLVEQFPEYAHVLDADTVIDILFGLGFLGVRRGGDTVYGGTRREVLEPHEDEFHVHPCFRAGLNAQAPVNLGHFVPPQVARSVTGNVGYQLGVIGNVVGARPGREFAVVGEVRRAYQRVRAALGAAELPESARREVSERLTVIEFVPGQSSVGLAIGWANEVADFFEQIARTLAGNGLADSTTGAALVHTLRDEAGRVRRAVARSSDT